MKYSQLVQTQQFLNVRPHLSTDVMSQLSLTASQIKTNNPKTGSVCIESVCVTLLYSFLGLVTCFSFTQFSVNGPCTHFSPVRLPTDRFLKGSL